MIVNSLICLDPTQVLFGQGIAQELDLNFSELKQTDEISSKRDRRRFLEAQVSPANGVLLLEDTGLSIIARIDGELLELKSDFCDATTDYRRQQGGGVRQMIAKAVGLKGSARPSILDCTAGLGTDAYVLAGLGCEVKLIERVQVVRALLKDGMSRGRAAGNPAITEAISRMALLTHGDAKAYLRSADWDESPDVIYLDPMFPQREKSALVKKAMRIFHELVGPDEDSSELLPLALAVAGMRVIVKRPRKAPVLAGIAPTYVLKGQRNRYDVYLTREKTAAC